MKSLVLAIAMIISGAEATMASDLGQTTFLRHKHTQKVTFECEDSECKFMTIRYLHRKNKNADWRSYEEFPGVSQNRFESAVKDAMVHYSRNASLKNAWFYLGDSALGHALFHRSKFLGVMCLISFPIAYILDIAKAPISGAVVLASKLTGKSKIKKILKNVKAVQEMKDFSPVNIRREKNYREVLWSMDGDLYPES